MNKIGEKCVLYPRVNTQCRLIEINYITVEY